MDGMEEKTNSSHWGSQPAPLNSKNKPEKETLNKNEIQKDY